MKTFAKIIPLIFAAACSIHHVGDAKPASVTGETAKTEKPAPAAPTAPLAAWTYAGDTGPYKWGDLKTEFNLCRDGKEQSPVDLRWNKPHNSHKVEFHYQSGALTVTDDGHTVQALADKGNYITVDGHRYDLQHVDFHSQSEHTLSGKNFPLEAHFAHKDEAGKLAYIAVFFKEGKAQPELDKIWGHIPAEKNKAAVASGVTWNPIDLVPKITTHYSYQGSLTAPPCTEGVNWNVMNTTVEASKEQIAAFRKIYAANYRPVQPLHGRQPANY